MKILLVSNMYPSKDDIFYGIFVKNFEESLNRDSITVKKVVIEGRGKTKFDKIKKYIKFFYSFYVEKSKNDFDLIYVHYAAHPLIPLIFTKYAKQIVINTHGDDVLAHTRLSKFVKKLISPVVQKSDLIISPSNEFKKNILNSFNLDENKIFVSPSGGIDMNKFKPYNLKNTNNKFTIGYVARIDEGKGWNILISAIKLLLDKGISDFKVSIIGTGFQKNLLEKTIVDFQLDNYVTYYGAIEHNKLIDYYNTFDVFVFPTTLQESLGLVGLEAMACGIPVIGSNIGGLKDYIKNNYNGKLFDVGDAIALSKCIEEFISIEDDKLKIYKNNAIKTASDYNSELVNNQLKLKLLSLIKEKDSEIKF